MSWLGFLDGWSGALALLLRGDTLVVLAAVGGLMAVLIAALRARAVPPALRALAILIAAAAAALALAWVFEWVG